MFVSGALSLVSCCGAKFGMASFCTSEFHSCEILSVGKHRSMSGMRQFIALIVCVMESWMSESRMYSSAGALSGRISVDCNVLIIASLFCGKCFSMCDYKIVLHIDSFFCFRSRIAKTFPTILHLLVRYPKVLQA